MTLKKLLKDLDIPLEKYINFVKIKIEKFGLDPYKLKIADDGKHKFNYDGIKFGSVINKDYLIYLLLEDMGKVEPGTANKMRKAYRARAKDIYDKSDKLSPSSLSYQILW